MIMHPAKLEWAAGVPRSTEYDDVYYSAENGLEESRYVFLAGNALPERWAAHSAPWFCVGETGFGTGLNFLALWQAWDAVPEPKANLHFITVDLHPLSAQTMAQAHAAWPELADYSEALCAALPPAFPGAHRRSFAAGRIRVDFLWGEAAAMFGAYRWAEGEARVDAWFLDGFSPAKNPGMWCAELYAAMAGLSGAGTSIATFTSAGHVRRGLNDAGFAMRRAPGYGRKREMLVGSVPLSQTSPAPIVSTVPAIVIGAGIAGIGAAWRLAEQGREVVVLEAGADFCTGASGNPAAACLPYFTSDWSRRGRLFASGFLQMQSVWSWLESRGHAIGHRCGAMALALDEETKKRQVSRLEKLNLPEKLVRIVSAEEASAIAGIVLPAGGLLYPNAGWIEMRALCRALLAEAGDAVELRTHQTVQNLRHEQNLWHVTLASGEVLRSDLVVLANGYQATTLLPQLALEPVRGQLLRFAPPPELAGLKTLLNVKQTLMPAIQGRMLLGSTYAHNDMGLEVRQQDTARLLGDMRRLFPQLVLDAMEVEPWVGIRTAHPQRQPLVGPAAGQPPGLYLHLAHGSRGTLSGLQPLATASY